MRYTRDFGARLPPAWTDLPERDRYWTEFEGRFGFLPSMKPESWPAIAEPTPSVTFDLTNTAGTVGSWRARFDAVNAEALRCFVSEFADDPRFVVLDWQHPGYWFDAAEHVAAENSEWRVPVYPNGDYYIFLREDFSAGTFGHPWEPTLCVFGERLVNTLGRTLATWLPRKRVNGQPYHRIG